MAGKLRVSLKHEAALTATRVSVSTERMVYALVADKLINYQYSKSRIAYIGTTKKGIQRVAQSVATRADHILAMHGVRSFAARVLSCKPRNKIQTWKKLEKAFLLAFRNKFGEVPRFNKHGTGFQQTDEFSYFNEAQIRKLIERLSDDWTN